MIPLICVYNIPHRLFPSREEFGLNLVDCSERIRLTDEYSHAVTTFNRFLEALKSSSRQVDSNSVEIARLRAQHAWDCIEAHILEHRCLELHWSAQSAPSRDLLQAAAAAALDLIIVADDDRRFVDLNDAAATAFKMPRNEVIGRKIEEFFSGIQGATVQEAWTGFIVDGVQCGECELVTSGETRRFEYRARAHFAPGLHLSVLREVKR